MKIIVVGCGKVGKTLVEQLSAENHNIVVVDILADKVDEIMEENDVMGFVGNGASIQTLMEAEIQTADLLIAVTGSDELNLLCCVIAKKVGEVATIARVRNPIYSKELSFIKQQLGISMIINPELAAAMEISRLLRFPSAIKIDIFAKGRIELLRFRIRPEFGMNHMKVSDIASNFKCDILICAVERNNEIFIPDGSFCLEDQDMVSIIASAKNAAGFFKKVGVKTNQVKSTVIVGGGTLAYYLAKQLLEMKIRVTIIEINRARCEELCELLPEATIINGDGTDRSLLVEEGLSQTESFVALTNMDEENIMLSLFAKKQTNAKLVAKVNRLAFDDIIEELDIGSVVYPKYITADYILQYVRAMQNSIGSNVETLYQLFDNRAEALEFAVHEAPLVTNTPIAELNLKEKLLLCCINKKGKIILPRGQDIIEEGDTVIVVTTEKGLQDITDILEK